MKPDNEHTAREGDDASGNGSFSDPMKTISAPENVTIRLSPEATLIFDPVDAEEPEEAEPLPSGFELIEEIGRGGMGVIFRANQRPLDRQIALKKLQARDVGNDQAYMEFLSEALIAGQLDHPNIVPVYTLEPDPDGSIVMAMKLVDGTSWQVLLDPDREPPETAKPYTLEQHLDILLNVCNAITFAHSREIIHRDLKPENVMVGEYGEVYVMDWGIALSVSDDPDGEGVQHARHKSRVKSILGTPAYMAPEMAAAVGDRMGPWTDVYLLGAILFEILAGRPPHRTGSLKEALEDARNSRIAFPDDEAPEPLRQARSSRAR